MTAHDTFGVTLAGPLTQGNGEHHPLVEQALAAGAGWARSPGAIVSLAKEEVPTRFLELSPRELYGSTWLSRLFCDRRTPAQAILACGLLSSTGSATSLSPLPGLDEGEHALFAALGIGVDGVAGDPQAMEAALRAFSAHVRGQGFAQPIWITELGVETNLPAEAQAAAMVKLAAHALALAVPRVFLRLRKEEPEPTLSALRMLVSWISGASRITWMGRGQYRAEFRGRQSRFLLWEDPKLRRLPSSLQGPLHLRDLAGNKRRVDTSAFRLTESPVVVERKEGLQ
jgi:hypothetical protein